MRPLRVIVGTFVFTTPCGAVDGDDIDDINNDGDGVVAFDDDDDALSFMGGKQTDGFSLVLISCRRFRRSVDPCFVSTIYERGDECSELTIPRCH